MTGKTILLIEDDVKSKYAFQSVLEDHGHRVHAFATAEEALHHPTTHFNAAIIDIRLPNQQGPDFALAFRRKYPDSRIIFITAYDTDPAAPPILPGAVILVKPIDMSILVNLL